ncbi:MAG: hypothetical protein IPL36_07545 [Nigerium sp.]|nr:hypothetical protein [Nigerium sp.]
MTTGTPTRPVALEELRRAWLAVQAGDFRHPSKARATPAITAPAGTVWTPASGERVVPVVGAAGGSGATTVALALVTTVGSRARLVECCPASQTGLAAASTAELGVDALGWLHGSRDQVLLERADGARPTMDPVPLPAPIATPAVTVVDAGSQLDQLLNGSGWLTAMLAGAPVVVVVARANVPGLRRLECALHLLEGRALAAVVGPPLRRWPREVRHSVGALTAGLMDARRLVEIPEDRRLAVQGLTPVPLPGPLLSAAASLLALTEGPPHD